MRYQILEPSADLRQRQQRALEAFKGRVQWLDRLPETPLNAVVVANEVLDALPVMRFEIDGSEPKALGVVARAESIGWGAGRALPELTAAVRKIELELQRALPNGYRSEICLTLPAWFRALGAMLTRGSLLFADYGLVRSDYYHEQRTEGTLVCHYRHRAHDDPFVYPGLQDITAWVDFSACADAASAAGFDVAGFTTQGHYLLSLLAALPPELAVDLKSPREQSAMKTLILPGEMGERFKILLLRKDASGTGVAGQGLSPSAVRMRIEALHRIGAAALLRSPRPHSLEVLSVRFRRRLSWPLAVTAALAPAVAGHAQSTPADDAGAGWMLGLGALADEHEASSLLGTLQVGVGSRTWLTFVAGKSSSPSDRADIEANALVIGVDHRLDKVGFTFEAERWGDSGALETKDFSGSVYFDRERWRLGFGYERRNIEIPFTVTGPLGGTFLRTADVPADGFSVNGNVALAQRWRLYFGLTEYDYERNLNVRAAYRQFEHAEHVHVDAREQLSRPRPLDSPRTRVRPSDVVERACRDRSLGDRRVGARYVRSGRAVPDRSSRRPRGESR